MQRSIGRKLANIRQSISENIYIICLILCTHQFKTLWQNICCSECSQSKCCHWHFPLSLSLFCRRINDLIAAMTSRFPSKALRPDSSSSDTIADFLKYLTAWEQHAGGAGGFISESTATGLRVTLSSTLELLSYLTKTGYKYIMTSRLSQDPLENLFSIVRQSSGCNDYPIRQLSFL